MIRHLGHGRKSLLAVDHVEDLVIVGLQKQIAQIVRGLSAFGDPARHVQPLVFPLVFSVKL